ncbi:MAG: hypothetical protein ACYTKD_15790 [Planctomycetota bacterium]|jgi:hypothetical protein
MLHPRNLLALTVAAVVLPGILGCGKKPSAPGGGPDNVKKAPPKGSPQAAFAKVRGALRSLDFATIHDMLSKDAKARAEAEVEKIAESAAAMGPMARELLGFDPAEVDTLPAREKYVKVMKATYETKASLESAFRSGKRETGLAGGEFEGAETDGDRATVKFKLSCGATRAMALVREDGAWKLAEPLSSRGGVAEGKAGAAKEPPAPPRPTETKPDAPKGTRTR